MNSDNRPWFNVWFDRAAPAVNFNVLHLSPSVWSSWRSTIMLLFQSQSISLSCRRLLVNRHQTLKRSIWLVAWRESSKGETMSVCCSPSRLASWWNIAWRTNLCSPPWLAAQLCQTARTTVPPYHPQPIRTSRVERRQFALPSLPCWHFLDAEASVLTCCWQLPRMCVCLPSHTFRWVCTDGSPES